MGKTFYVCATKLQYQQLIWQIFMILSFAYCNAPVAPIRSEPSHRAEQVNELLFGERAEVLEVNDKEWARVRGEWDNYEGWCKMGQLTHTTRKEYNKKTHVIVSQHNSKLIFEDSDMWLPIGSDLFGTKGGKIILSDKTGKIKGKKINSKKLLLNCDSLKAAVYLYMHAPYRWGGRNIMGIDCSGLTQMAFKLCGKRILRDAKQQATEGEPVDFLQHAQCGDLAFFDEPDGKITHVGILLDTQHIIHASANNGKVMIDKIDQGGIISVLQKKRTHQLRVVKRFF